MARIGVQQKVAKPVIQATLADVWHCLPVATQCAGDAEETQENSHSVSGLQAEKLISCFNLRYLTSITATRNSSILKSSSSNTKIHTNIIIRTTIIPFGMSETLLQTRVE